MHDARLLMTLVKPGMPYCLRICNPLTTVSSQDPAVTQYQLAASTSIWTLHRQIDDEFPRRQLPNIC
jgi:hypothetical protein